MNIKDFGSRTNVFWGFGGLLMIIGVGLGQFPVGTKLIMIGLILGFFSCRFEINRLKNIIKSLKKELTQTD